MKSQPATADLFATNVFDTPAIDRHSALPQGAPTYCPRCGTGCS